VQLRRRWLLAAAGLVLGAAGVVRAEVEGSSHVMIFQEPSQAHKKLQVIHPQAEVAASSGSLGINAGYEMDMVSGATAAVYAEGVDAVSGATFKDIRQAARGGVSVETQTVGLSAGYSYGWESDYRSQTISVAARGDFLERNFTLGLAYTRNFDTVCDQNNSATQSPLDLQALGASDGCFKTDQPEVVTRKLSIDTFEPSLSWTATPLTLVQAGGTLQILDGFQSNPYRRVAIGTEGRRPQERVPTHRQRYALFVRGNQAVPIIKSAIRLGGRVYRDTWDVTAATADAEWLTYLGSSLVAGLRGRYHRQTGAIFFRSASDYRSLGPAGMYWTGDRELAPLENLLFGGKIALVKRRMQESQSFFEEIELDVRFDVLTYHQAEGTPGADRSHALITQVGLSARF
jgi:hypothetical protein